MIRLLQCVPAGIRSGKTARRAMTVFMALLCCVLLGGCHGKKQRSSFEVPDSFDTSKNYEITFWAKNDTNKNQTLIYQKAIDDFQALYPNISVKMRLYTDYGKIYNDVITNISTDTTPNVCITYPDHVATYLEGNHVVAPLDELFVDEKYGFGGSSLLFDGPSRDEMIEEFLSEGVFSGHYYVLPYMRSTEACYVNKTYVEALGFELPEVLTWDFVWKLSEKATEKDEEGNYLVNGQKVMIPFIYKSTDNMMIQMLRQLGAGYSDADGQILLFNDTAKDLLYTISSHVKSGAFSTFKISGYPANFLNAGQCIFAVDSTAGSTWMGSDAPLSDISEDKFVDFETAVYTVPQYDTEHLQMISQGPSVCIFNKADAQEVLASWLFAQYLLTSEVQIAYAQTEGYVPVTWKARRSEEYQDYLSRSGENNTTYYDIKIQATKLLLDHTEDTFVTPVFNGSASLRDAAGQLIENVAKSTRRKQTVDDAYMEKLYLDVTSLYHLDEINTGPLPAEAKTLLGTLAVTWIGIIIYVIRQYLMHRL